MWPLFRVPARGCYGRDDNRLKSQLRKGQREVEGACAGAAGEGCSRYRLEGVSRPKTVTSLQGRLGQEPSAWSCPPSACLGGPWGKRPNLRTPLRLQVRDQQAGGLESALGVGWQGPCSPGGDPLSGKAPSARPAGSGPPTQRDPCSLRTGSTRTGDRRTKPAMAPAPPASLSPRREASFPRASPYMVPLRPLKHVCTQRGLSSHQWSLHTCVCGGRLLVTIALEVWPSPVPAAVCRRSSPVAGQDRGSAASPTLSGGPGRSPLLPVSPGPWPSLPSSFPPTPRVRVSHCSFEDFSN